MGSRGRGCAHEGHNQGTVDVAGLFGSPDGSRAELDDVLSEFVEFDADPGFGGLATRADDSKVRVIAGKLGAGKTVYMRRLQDHQAHQESVYAHLPEYDPPTTEVVVTAGQWFGGQVLAEKWAQVWDRAILRSLDHPPAAAPGAAAPGQRGAPGGDPATTTAGCSARCAGPGTSTPSSANIVNEQDTARQLSTLPQRPAVGRPEGPARPRCSRTPSRSTSTWTRWTRSSGTRRCTGCAARRGSSTR